MAAHSILFDRPADSESLDERVEPPFFGDLNLDQVVARIIEGRNEYKLQPYFYTPLTSVDSVAYRHEVFRDLEAPALLETANAFAQEMRRVRAHLKQAGRLHYAHQKRRWFLEAAATYCSAVQALHSGLGSLDLKSRGLRDFREYLGAYLASADTRALLADTDALTADLAQVQYCLQIRNNRIRVTRYEGEADYGAEVLQTFEKFKQSAAREYRFEWGSSPDMNHVEAALLDLVARLYPDTFAALERYAAQHLHFIDDTVRDFDREMQFYLAYVEYMARFRNAGLTFCYPSVTDRTKEVAGRAVFDLALADRLLREDARVVTNDFYLQGDERIFVVSGPNQGGKTTFARTFGQLHYFARLGVPVPGEQDALYLFDQLYTHFEREEQLQSLSGKLEDDLLRIHRILQEATPRSVLIMNESFSSTTLKDALLLSRQIMQQIVERDMLCVSVTFLDELSTLAPSIVSMASTVDPQNPARRTFRIVRKPADGLAYAAALAENYRLSYGSVRQRVGAAA
jgi:hypothetical protein